MASNTLELEYVTLDVFTQTRYAGNPLAVVHVPKTASLSQEQKQAIAREFNFSETTFVHEDGAAQWTVDIFTPWTELPFAGHPTVGTACHVLSKIAQDDGSTGTKINGTFDLKAGPVDLSYDPTSKTAKAAIPHDVYVHLDLFWFRGKLLQYRCVSLHVPSSFARRKVMLMFAHTEMLQTFDQDNRLLQDGLAILIFVQDSAAEFGQRISTVRREKLDRAARMR